MNFKLLLYTVLISLLLGCASNPQVCIEAINLREQAKNAPLEEKAILEAKARGLEDACARERENLWQKDQERKQREMDKPK